MGKTKRGKERGYKAKGRAHKGVFCDGTPSRTRKACLYNFNFVRSAASLEAKLVCSFPLFSLKRGFADSAPLRLFRGKEGQKQRQATRG